MQREGEKVQRKIELSLIHLSLLLFCKMIRHGRSLIEYCSLFIISDYLYQYSYYSYLIKVGLGWSKDARNVY